MKTYVCLNNSHTGKIVLKNGDVRDVVYALRCQFLEESVKQCSSY